MPSHAIHFLLALGLATSPATAQQVDGIVTWEELEPLPDAYGRAGVFAGVSNGALVVVGGANFPGADPWILDKAWHADAFVLESADVGWSAAAGLAEPRAYGVSISADDELLCIGGADGQRHTRAVLALRWQGGELVARDLPELPRTAAYACGARLGTHVYVAGGREAPDSERASHAFWSLDLARPDAQWREEPPWPGPERMLAVCGVQDGAFYLFGGVTLDAQVEHPSRRRYLADAYRFTPGAGWMRIADLPQPLAGGPSPAPALGPHHLLLIGGDDGAHLARTDELGDDHPGFRQELLAYHVVTDTWRPAGRFPTDLARDDPTANPNTCARPAVTTPVVELASGFVIPSGEVRPRVRTAAVWRLAPRPAGPAFGAIDWTALAVYLLGLVAVGLYFARREDHTDDFFLAGRRIPWWAAGMSIFGTQLSAITFMAIPAKAYASDWLYLPMSLGILALAPVVVRYYLPAFRRLEVASAYEYLERRFDLGMRLLGSAAFIVFQLGRMGIVVFLPALALEAVTGMDVRLCIAIMGVLCTAYTYLGGIEAVIWTDVLQVAVLMGGALIALAVALGGVEGGLTGALELASAHDKLRVVDMDWSLVGSGVLVVLLGGVFNNLVPYTSDQSVIQRYLTTPDERGAARAIWTNGILSVPASLLFFSLGTALFAFYATHPERLDATAPPDQIFPWFITRELPAGVSGLLIAGIFAAAMSSLDSSLNSIATAGVTDFYRRFRRDAPDAACLRLAKRLTLALGAAGTLAAMLLASADVRSLYDLFLGIVGLLGGTLAGVFALGLFVPRCSAVGAWIGALASVGLLAWVRLGTDFSGLTYAAFGAGGCFAVGLLTAAVAPRRPSPA